MTRRILTVFALLAGLMMAGATDWYVSANVGKKKNEGTTPEAPLKAIWNALEKAAPGDVIHVAQGNYHGKTSCGWLLIEKPVSIIGGYSDDFKERDITKYPTMLKPTTIPPRASPKAWRPACTSTRPPRATPSIPPSPPPR